MLNLSRASRLLDYLIIYEKLVQKISFVFNYVYERVSVEGRGHVSAGPEVLYKGRAHSYPLSHLSSPKLSILLESMRWVDLGFKDNRTIASFRPAWVTQEKPIKTQVCFSFQLWNVQVCTGSGPCKSTKGPGYCLLSLSTTHTLLGDLSLLSPHRVPLSLQMTSSSPQRT